MELLKIPTHPKFCPHSRWIQTICGGSNDIYWECKLSGHACGIYTKKEPCKLIKEETND